MKKYLPAVFLLCVFEAVAFALWLGKNNIFYLFNFSYIGLSLFTGLVLYARRYAHSRRVVQLMVGLYMLVYLGLISGENMQLEGFFYYLFTGVFEAATIHYAVAKIFGPLVFGRGWCGYACWTAMVLDFLPFKVPSSHTRKGLGWMRYAAFALSLAFVSALFLSGTGGLERIMFLAFIVGNIIYYISGAARCKTTVTNAMRGSPAAPSLLVLLVLTGVVLSGREGLELRVVGEELVLSRLGVERIVEVIRALRVERALCWPGRDCRWGRPADRCSGKCCRGCPPADPPR